jgi:hypothetical protein
MIVGFLMEFELQQRIGTEWRAYSLVRGKMIGSLVILGREKQNGCSRGKFDFQRFKIPNEVLNSKQRI